jgi:hypothetical protein
MPAASLPVCKNNTQASGSNPPLDWLTADDDFVEFNDKLKGDVVDPGVVDCACVLSNTKPM